MDSAPGHIIIQEDGGALSSSSLKVRDDEDVFLNTLVMTPSVPLCVACPPKYLSETLVRSACMYVQVCVFIRFCCVPGRDLAL